MIGLALAFLLAGPVTGAFAQESDFGVTKTGPDTAAADTTITYTISVTNQGPDSGDVALSDPLPSGTTFVSLSRTSGPTGTCSTPAVGAGGTVSCSWSAFAGGATAIYSLSVHIAPATAPGTFITNVANVSSATDPNSENDSSPATTEVSGAANADLGVAISGPLGAPPGSDVVYDIDIANQGPAASSNATLTDHLPGTMTFTSVSQTSGPAMGCTTPAVGTGGTVTCTVASLPASGAIHLRITGHVPPGTAAGTEFANTVSVSSSTADPNSENDTAGTSFTVSSADLSITKTGPTAAAAGSQVSYTITVTNNGPETATDAGFSDQLPAGTTFVSLTQNSGPTLDAATPDPGHGGVVSAQGTLTNGQSAQFTLVLATDPALPNGTQLTNSANVIASTGDPNGANNSASTTASLSSAPVDLALTKTAPAQATAGGTITYQLSVTNKGPGPAGSITVSDPLPENTTFTSATQTSGPTLTLSGPAPGTRGTVTATGALAAGATASFTITVNVASGAAGGSTIVNTATTSTTSSDSDS